MDRFELENKITQISSFADQLRSVSKAVLEHNMSEDRLANVLEGLAVLIELHTNETFEVFQQVFYNENLQTEDD